MHYILLMAAFILLPLNANAQDEQKDLVNPNSFGYMMQTIRERMAIWRADTLQEEVELLTLLADRKVAEVEAFAKTDPSAAKQAARRYEKYMSEAVEKLQDEKKSIEKDSKSESKKEEKRKERSDKLFVETPVNTAGLIAWGIEERRDQSDELLQLVSRESLDDAAVLFAIGNSTPTGQAEYYDIVLGTIEKQNAEIVLSIEEDSKRTESVDQLLTFFDNNETISPELRASAEGGVTRITATVTESVVTLGEDKLHALSEDARKAIETRAKDQLDDAREKAEEEARKQVEAAAEEAKQQAEEKVEEEKKKITERIKGAIEEKKTKAKEKADQEKQELQQKTEEKKAEAAEAKGEAKSWIQEKFSSITSKFRREKSEEEE